MTVEHISHVMLITRWQTPLLIAMLLISCSAQSTYYITPTPDTPCPGEPCHTLHEYVAGQYFNNLPVNTTMEFLPGNHTLEQTISVANVPRLALRGDSSSLPEVTSRIECTWPAGFVFVDITELYINAMAFISCGHHNRAAVRIKSVQQSNISYCSFHNNVNTDSNGGALYIHNSHAVLTVNEFQHNTAEVGGGLFIESSNLNLTRNTFHNNSADYNGGALHVEFSTLSLTGNTFQNSSAGDGGALYVEEYSILSLTGNTFQSSSAGYDGGALHVTENSTLSLTGNTFQNNSAGYGGALHVKEYSTLSLTGNTFQNNTAKSGGALVAVDSTLNLTGNMFQNNSAAWYGGSFSMEKLNVTFTDDCFTDNYAQLGGAILATVNSIVKMYNITIGSNRAEYGGGMAAMDSQLEVLENTFFESNRASYGGGLYVHNTEFKGNAIFTRNSVTEGGGGIYASGSIFLFMDDVTNITNNSAMDGGGLLLSGDSKLLFLNQPGIAMHLISNSANGTGGAIKVEESNPQSYCIPDVSKSDCFFQIQSKMEQLYLYIHSHIEANSLNVGQW